MVLAKFRTVVGPDGEKSDFGVKLFSYLTKPWKITRIACVVNGAYAQLDDVAPVAAVVIGDLACAPVFGGNKGDGGSWKAKAFPPVDFVDFFKT